MNHIWQFCEGPIYLGLKWFKGKFWSKNNRRTIETCVTWAYTRVGLYVYGISPRTLSGSLLPHLTILMKLNTKWIQKFITGCNSINCNYLLRLSKRIKFINKNTTFRQKMVGHFIFDRKTRMYIHNTFHSQ